MTPKEKAKELVDKFKKYVDDGRHNGLYSSEITFENQKQCALIAVDEILDLNLGLSNCDENNWETEKFYEEVKKEIELL